VCESGHRELAVVGLAKEIAPVRKRWQFEGDQPALPDWPSAEDVTWLSRFGVGEIESGLRPLS
jgi:hypothetical protein